MNKFIPINTKAANLLRMVKRALSKLGDIAPSETLSTRLRNGNTWQDAILSGSDCELNDGWFIIDIFNLDDVKRVYVDLIK